MRAFKRTIPGTGWIVDSGQTLLELTVVWLSIFGYLILNNHSNVIEKPSNKELFF